MGLICRQHRQPTCLDKYILYLLTNYYSCLELLHDKKLPPFPINLQIIVRKTIFFIFLNCRFASEELPVRCYRFASQSVSGSLLWKACNETLRMNLSTVDLSAINASAGVYFTRRLVRLLNERLLAHCIRMKQNFYVA